MATYGYRRISSQGQEDGTSLDHQTTKIQGLAMMLELGDVVMVEDICSGSIPLGDRPGSKGMIAQLKRGDNVIVTKLDRIFRNATDALTQADWFKSQGINLYLIDMGVEPVTQNGVARMFFGMLALMAEFERERIRERTADGKSAKKAKGGHIGGSRPFGYDVVGRGKEAVLEPREDEQRYIPEILERSKTQSLRTISGWLAGQGVQLSHVAVSKVIEREA